MITSPLTENPENTHQAVLFYLKRKGEMNVADLCQALAITAMAVRRHLTGLQSEGLVDCRLVKQVRGRPTYRYRLTQKAESLFPSAINNLAFELLDAVYESKGHQGVMELLTLRDEALLKKLLPQLESLELKERIAKVSKIFSENGYMTEWSELQDGNYFIFQQHCAVHGLAVQYKQLCVLEARMMERLIGRKVTRQKHIMKNDPVCGYLVHTNECSEQAAANEPGLNVMPG